MYTLVSSVFVNSQAIGAMSDKKDKVVAEISSMSKKLQDSKNDVTARRLGGSDRVCFSILDIHKQKSGDVLSHRVPFIHIATDRFIIGRCTIMLVFLERLKRMDDDLISIV